MITNMTRLICKKCKNAYLQKAEDKFICPSCNEEFSLEEENLLIGAQYYSEGDYSSANDFLMKYIVKNGAEPRAIIYKALCDGYDFDEDTISLKPVYEKIIEALSDIDKALFPQYLAIANDEAEKLEKALATKHILLFADADAEKIKKEVTAIIGIQNDAKDFRTALTALSDKFNEESAEIQLSLKLAKSFLVEPEIATEVGQKKYEKILENIASHTVFTGILSTEIKNLEIYYRCIVMFFEKNRQKYDFLMASAEKFTELSKVLEEGRYNTIKGTSTIGDKLKSAAYDFFQESLKDHDGDFETQEETVVVIDIKPEAEEVEETPQLEDISSNTLDSDIEDAPSSENGEEMPADETDEDIQVPDATQVIEISSEEEKEEIHSEEAEEKVDEESDEKAETEPSEAEEAEETEEAETSAEVTEENSAEADSIEEPQKAEEVTQDTIAVQMPQEAQPVDENSAEEITETKEELPTDATQVVEAVKEEAPLQSKFQKISDEEPKEEKKHQKKEKAPKPPRKKSYAPIVTGVVLVLGVLAIIGFAIIPGKLNEANYAKAKELSASKNYAEAAEIFEQLGDYEDAKDQALQCKYDYAASLEEKKDFDVAKEVYKSLGDFKDSKAKVESCYYNDALQLLDKGDYDNALAIFVSIPDYADSKARIDECNYQKALLLLEAKDYAGAIDLLTSLEDYSDAKTKINEAKYAYVKENLDKKNTTTVAYLTDLVKAKYKDSVDIRNKLLGIEEEAKNGVSHSITYSDKSAKDNLKQAENTKPIYFHITVNEAKHYDKKLTVQYRTSMGYTEKKSIVLTKDKKSYVLMYPSTPSENYTVEFKLLGSDNATLASQKITIK